MTALALATGFLLVGVLGVFHHFALRSLRRLCRPVTAHPNLSILAAFAGLLAVHTAEILGFALALTALLGVPDLGTLEAGGAAPGWADVIYYSGINFTTVGYTRMDSTGPLRLVSMMQSLGGFMVLTWSATFLYSIWREALPGR